MNRLLVFLFVSVVFGCSSLRVKTVSAPGFEPGKYQSFCWIDGCEERYYGPDYAVSEAEMRAIREKIGQTLEHKGYLNDVNAPDLLIGFHVVVNEQQQLLTDSPEMYEPYEYPTSYWEDYDDYYQRKKVFKYLKGSLVIDVIDANSGSIVWQSTTQKYMSINEDISDQDLTKAIARAMGKFPARSKE